MATQTFRPRRTAIRPWLAYVIAMTVMLMVFVIGGAIAGFVPGWSIAVVLVVAAIIGTVPSVWFVRRARVQLTDTQVSYVGWGRKVTVQLGRPHDGMLVDYWDTVNSGLNAVQSRAQSFFFRQQRSKEAIVLNGLYWRQDDLVALMRATGAIDRRDQLLTTRDLKAKYPYYLTWIARHPVLLVLFAVLGFFVALFFAFVLPILLNPFPA